MKSEVYLFVSLFVCGSLLSCSFIKSSRYSAFNEFHYTKEQPGFHFQNDQLNIEGEWYWASSARAIPKISFIPKLPMEILRPIAKEHGSVLFATWIPRREKYSVDGYVPVTKQDVHYKDKFNDPFYVVVLINQHPFNGDTTKYKPKGRNNDYQFTLYASRPQLARSNYWVMEVIAADPNRYYDFVCILDKSFISKPEFEDYQAELFLEDIQLRFLTK